MKKLIASLLMVFTLGVTVFAQTVVKKEDKMRRTTTLKQKVHNVFHRHKHYSGYKTKHVRKVEKIRN